ncbi:MAG TPA: ATP-dependent DNA helicase RecG [Nevskiaceae bacterium]|nr:ATP-dependent DNA helicase RecG [Nevskiaceae bacterium]
MTSARPPLRLESPLTYLKGAGPQAAAVLRGLGLERVGDLLFHLPIRYEDRRAPVPLAALQAGEDQLVRARIQEARLVFAGRRQLRVLLEQDGALLLLRFFHFNSTQQAALQPGRWVQAFGTARAATGGFEMVHPEYRTGERPEELAGEAGALTPVYPLTAGMTQPRLRRLIQQALEIARRDPALAETLPGLAAPATREALQQLHQPGDERDVRALQAGRHPAQQRLIDEELLAHQLCMRLLRRQIRSRPAPVLGGLAAAVSELRTVLPFDYTGAQRRVMGEIGADLAQRRPMLRLVQGDVGSGKTVVAAVALLAAARAGWQAALLAPTELLAEQHARTLSRWLQPLGVELAYLSGRLRKREREAVELAVAEGRATVVVGTHAVFQERVRFARLGLAVVDEQHRFGVQQRLALRDKAPAGSAPHQLIMSATPIPRTLAQTVYADLDVSVIDELPPGRTPIVTGVLANARRDEVLARIGEACRQGRQAYWVCTLIEDSEEVEAEAAEATAAWLAAALPDLRVGLVHGRQKAAEKEAAMRAFQQGQTQLLVATTVIEVGVDVPNASIMVIENAERLGLSQLHQLRGRVGRGAQASQCLLLYQPPLGEAGRARLATLRESSDGFYIAQRDLELRGPGEILGRRQTGLVGLKIADPVRDAARVAPLQGLADQWLQQHPRLAERLIDRWVGNIERYAQV